MGHEPIQRPALGIQPSYFGLFYLNVHTGTGPDFGRFQLRPNLDHCTTYNAMTNVIFKGHSTSDNIGLKGKQWRKRGTVYLTPDYGSWLWC
jgi:hypothetical protein